MVDHATASGQRDDLGEGTLVLTLDPRNEIESKSAVQPKPINCWNSQSVLQKAGFSQPEQSNTMCSQLLNNANCYANCYLCPVNSV